MPSENIIRPYKILGLSDSPLLTTGYSTISKTLFNYLSNKPHWDCYMIGNMLNTQPLLPPIKFDDGTQLDFKILGCGREMYAKDIMEEKIRETKADIFWILHDTFFYFPWLLQKNFAPAKSVFYFPSDGGICMPSLNGQASCAQILEKVDMPVAMSKFGQKQVKDIYGIKTEYIPHAVHTDVYYPMSKEQREKMKEEAIVFNADGAAIKGALRGKIVIGSVFRNQPRKMTDRMIKSLAILLKKYKYEDFVFLAHTDPKDVAAALDICELAQICGVRHKIFFTGMNFFKGFSIAQLNEVYNLFDIFFLSTSGEGFGIPTLEAASCGIPSVVTDFTTTPELLIENGKCGEPVKLVGTEVYDLHDSMFNKNLNMRDIDLQLLNGTITGSWMVERGLIDCDDAAQKLLKLATNPKLREQYGKVGREKALKYYEWKNIANDWDVLLKKLVEQ